jgi:pectate lyase
MKPWTVVLCLAVLLSITFTQPNGYPTSTRAAPAVKAFPGAAGYGTDTPGGRGGKVIYVTSLDDAGSGSLREALIQPGPRMVLFKVSGTITLDGDIEIEQPYLTVAGHTAPGEGVQIRGGQIKISTHDVVIRYLKVRSGDLHTSSNPDDRDAVTVNDHTEAYNVVIDHSTMIWGSDIGGITFLNGARDSTVSNSIIGEGLYYSAHAEAVSDQGGHSMSMNISELNSPNHPVRITIHHNLITTSCGRNPRVIGGENIDLVNNVIYNWRDSASQGNPRSLNMINNLYIKGPMSTKPGRLFAWLPKIESGGTLRSGSVFESGNITEGFSEIRGEPASVYASARFDPYSLDWEEDPWAAYENILVEVGANLQVADQAGNFIERRDSVDERILQNLINRTGVFLNGQGHNGEDGFPEISWPTLADGPAADDQDGDGLPDDWEAHYFGNIQSGSALDTSGDLDGDGYTDLEEYLYGMDPTGSTAPAPTLPPPYPVPSEIPSPEPTQAPTGRPTRPPTVEPTLRPTSRATRTATPTSTHCPRHLDQALTPASVPDGTSGYPPGLSPDHCG